MELAEPLFAAAGLTMYRAIRRTDLGKIAILQAMSSTVASPQTPDPGGPPLARLICAGRDWSVREFICRSGAGDRPFEERHEQYSFSAVLEGSFIYKTGNERALMHPGSLLFGNPGQCFECGHDHSRGDRCVSLHFAPEWFEEVAASSASALPASSPSGRYRFPVNMLPAQPYIASLLAGIDSWAGGADASQVEETITHLAETVLSKLNGSIRSGTRVTARDEKRISEVLRVIETNARDPLDLDCLAATASMSKYHFLRTFRRVAGASPYQYLLSVRMRRAALRLSSSSESVASIVFDSGFGDLSTFNRRFRETFAMSPTAYRQRYRKRTGTEPSAPELLTP
jgi:AraC family transcriptional regulator